MLGSYCLHHSVYFPVVIGDTSLHRNAWETIFRNINPDLYHINNNTMPYTACLLIQDTGCSHVNNNMYGLEDNMIVKFNPYPAHIFCKKKKIRFLHLQIFKCMKNI